MSRAEDTIDPAAGRIGAMAAARLHWEALFLNDRVIAFPQTQRPNISIVIVSRGARYILAMTLANMARYQPDEAEAFEVILVDNASDLDTRKLFPRLENLTLIQNEENCGFGRACNQGAALARASRILFLNPDVDLFPGALKAMCDGFSLFERVGIVGARLVFPGGYLQEAGANFVDDAQVTHPYLRGEKNASAPEALYAREVGYVSGAAMMIDRSLFETLGGFDAAFDPAYFEDTDLCVRAQRLGRSVVYQPRAIAFHYENATSPNRAAADALIDKHRDVFLRRHRKWLFDSGAHPTGFMARDMNRFRMRVLYVDDETPHQDKGGGLPRANSIIAAMVSMGYQVTVLPVSRIDVEPADRYRDIHPAVEILEPQGGLLLLKNLICERAGYYDVLWVSRPHNIDSVCHAMLRFGRTPRDLAPRVIFDTEAVFAARDGVQAIAQGEGLTAEALWGRLRSELRFSALADRVVCVSTAEERILRAAGLINIAVLGHTVELRPGPRTFPHRSGILFVGSLSHEGSPNVDSVDWLLDEVWPRITRDLGAQQELTLVGEIADTVRARFKRLNVVIMGRIDSLDEVSDKARIAVAPTRYAGGVPHKVHEAASRGLPIVVTPILKEQVGWTDGEGLLAAPWQDPDAFARAIVSLHSDPLLWEQVRVAGLHRADAELGFAAFRASIRDICEVETLT